MKISNYNDWQQERILLLEEIRRLQEENALLKQRIGIKEDNRREEEHDEHMESAMHRLSPQDKVSLFRSLFRGRDDVFARRWFSKTSGKGGYQPVCANEWNPQVCDKKKYKCADCPYREFLSLDYNAVFNHLAGKDELGRDVIGIYAITEENKCFFICADFDDKSCKYGFQDDVHAYCSVCKEWHLPFSVERSRSGNGAHVWIFFKEAIPAQKARKLGYAILTEATNRNGKMSFKSYDRFIPNQDFLPEGGLGNLIALPLQGKARKEGNSVFVDETFTPYSDQWEYLLSIQKLHEENVDNILAQHNIGQETMGKMSKSTEKKPWENPLPLNLAKSDFPNTLEIIKANMLFVQTKCISAKVTNYLKRLASFKNPEFYSKQAMRFSTFNTPRIICCAEMDDNYIALPRGCEDTVAAMLKENDVSSKVIDETNKGKDIEVSFVGKLREEQSEAMKSLLLHENGVLSATTAFGKTITAAALIAQRKTNTLILVHTKALLNQWKERLEEFLSIDCHEEKQVSTRGRKKEWSPIGTLCSTGNTLHGIIDIATMQSCLANDDVKPFVRDYGMVIVDECHHVSSICFERVMKNVNARFVYGLTATPIRKDGHQPIIFMQCGPIRFNADAKQQMKTQSFSRVLVPRYTSFRLLMDEKPTYTQITHKLAEDRIRNEFIVKDISDLLDAGHTPLVLTSLTSHLETLSAMIKELDCKVISLVGSEPAKEKRSKMEYLSTVSGKERLVVVAIGKYVGEGFDFPRFDTLCLGLPVSWKGVVAQYAGRLHREYKGKTEVRIYDYVDLRVPVCETMFRRRLHGYSSIGYTTISNVEATSTTTDTVFNGKDYVSPFLSDLRSAKSSIVISCPQINVSNVMPNDIIRVLVSKIHDGLDVVVFIKDSSEFPNIGIDIRIRKRLSLCFAIIDKSKIWYGNTNFITGQARTEDCTIRFQNQNVSKDLLEMLYGNDGA